MRDERGRDREGRETKGPFRPSLLPYLNLLIAAGLTLGLAGVTRRIVDGEFEKQSLMGELDQTRREIHSLERDQEQKLHRLEAIEIEEAETRRREIEDYALQIAAMEKRLHSMEHRSRDANARTVAAVRDELASLRRNLEQEIRPQRNAAQVFRDFEREHRDGVVLIYTEFDYTKRSGDDEEIKKTVTGWGSGFFVSEDGYIVTNKHVVHPWKFDSDLAAMEALGELVVDRDSLRIACWTAGSKAFDENGEPRTDVGFNTWVLGNLKLAVLAPDSMKRRELDFGSFGPKFRTHELNDNDLVLLKADGEGFRPLPLASGKSSRLRKLDSVMALGFPRGQNGLEAGCAESSPSIGTIRKVENTIHVTASIIPGNSGGPLIGPEGEVIGIVTRVYSETLGICLKLDHALELLAEVRAAERAAIADEEVSSARDD